ncbi:MAG: hypothetical protein JST47_12105 [Bacteroidetes bacterium]|nr:hypothetical protein [Bacteroidota bacterium]
MDIKKSRLNEDFRRRRLLLCTASKAVIRLFTTLVAMNVAVGSLWKAVLLKEREVD